MLPVGMRAVLVELQGPHPNVRAQDTGRGVVFFLPPGPVPRVELLTPTGDYPMQVRGEEARLSCTVYDQREAVTVLLKYLDEFAGVLPFAAPPMNTFSLPPYFHPVSGFTRYRVGVANNDGEASPMNTFLRVGDIDGDGLADIVVGGRNGTLAWWKNPGSVDGNWVRQEIEPHLQNRECGGTLVNLSGGPGLDVIVGGDWRSNTLLWWANPGGGVSATSKPWRCRVITATGFRQFHDAIVGDVTGDGQRSLVYWNQHATTNDGATLARIPIPDDPTQVPWPGGETLARSKAVAGLPEEGLSLYDLDGDGQNEIVAGTSWYKWDGENWQGHCFVEPSLGYITTVLAVGDINGDGRPGIVVSEGDPCIYGRADVGGRLAWFAPGEDLTQPWTENLLAEGLVDPHSLQLGDICGNGCLDILVGEIGMRDRPEKLPRLTVWQNDGRGNFRSTVIEEGIGTHHAVLCDLENRGKLDIVSRPLHGPYKWEIHVWRQNDKQSPLAP